MRRRSPRTVYIERDDSSSFLWFLLGGALGAGLALWFAPQSGDRTRRVVGRKLGKLRDAAEEAFDDLREAWQPLPEPDRETEPVEEDETTEPESDGAERSARTREPHPRRNARQELEQRLAAARARRRRSLADEDEEPVA